MVEKIYQRLQTGTMHPQALLLGLQAVLNLARAVFPETFDQTWIGIFPLVGNQFAYLQSMALGLGLFGLALGLGRRKRYALAATLALYGGAGAIHLSSGSAVRAIVSLLLIVWLLAEYKQYVAFSDRSAVRNGWLIWGGIWLAVTLIGAVAYALVVGWPFDPGPSILRTTQIFWLFHLAVTDGYDPLNRSGWSYLIYGLSAYAWFALWRGYEQSLQVPLNVTMEERRRAREIVRRYGRTSMAHLTLLNDKLYYFTPGGSMVAFAVCGRSALALGDPIGPPEDSLAAIRAFREFCVANDWLPAFCLTSADYLGQYRSSGFRALCLGHEGIIELKNFTLRGNTRKTVRKRYNRLTGLGYRVEICNPPIPDEILRELRRISDEWLGMARASEKRFFLAGFDEDYVRGERLALVYAPDGSLCAFTSLVPEYQLNEISIDLMRRRPRIESGVMDFLFVSLLLWARQEGYDSFNLGLSPLFGVGDRSERTLLEAFIHQTYRHGDFYDFKGLNGFKRKFHPTWTPQYLIYPGAFTLPWVGLAMARANAGANESLWQYFNTPPQRPSPDDSLDADTAA